jgi:hypothetical protein
VDACGAVPFRKSGSAAVLGVLLLVVAGALAFVSNAPLSPPR